MGAWHSPGSIYHIGHAAIKDLFTVDVQLQEKMDGSFFAFGLFPGSAEGSNFTSSEAPLELKLRSKGAMMYEQAPPDMFVPAAETVRNIKHLLTPGWQYRAETFCKPGHNALVYDRVPKGNIILFDIVVDEETYLPYEGLEEETDRLGLEVVPQLYKGRVESAEQLRTFLTTISVLGGQKIEGVVIKPLTPMFGHDKKLLMGKFVSEEFKEVHKLAWGESNPSVGDILTRLGNAYGTQARWQKALIHLQEAGLIKGEAQDIGLLIKEIPADIRKECEEEIKNQLFKYAWPHIARMVGRGVPEWYKNLLMTWQFEKDMNENG